MINTSFLVGIGFIIVAVFDVWAGFIFIGPKISDPGRRAVLQRALLVTGIVMGSFGVVTLTGIFEVSGS